MKSSLIRFIFLCIPTLLCAEDLLPASGQTFIPESLEIPAFTPPPPFIPKKPLADAETTIVCRDDDGETVTLQRGSASMAPDLPVPEPVPDSATTHLLKHTRPRMLLINMSGTVYDHKVTTVRWQHPVTNESYEAVLGFDLGLVANLGSFVHKGVPCHSNIFCINLDTESSAAKRAVSRGRPQMIVPSIGLDAYNITKGNLEDAAGMEPLFAVRDIYLAEKLRLQKLSVDLKNYQRDAKEWAETHPAPVEPKVFWFKPHRNSRYLTPEDKDNQEQAAQERASLTTEGEAP